MFEIVVFRCRESQKGDIRAVLACMSAGVSGGVWQVACLAADTALASVQPSCETNSDVM